MNRSKTDYLIESNHLADFLENLITDENRKEVIRYRELVMVMDHKIEVMWDFLIEMRNSINERTKDEELFVMITIRNLYKHLLTILGWADEPAFELEGSVVNL